ncbi:DUF7471 family protein [Natronobacterium lacisalsi]|uniref:DUF7471 family protein n=1 Tax=Natronobacterium lacisalsi TaxID=229731 RepID=UPI00026318B9|nr:hypothetical protein [Halobiforma lacisalsi]
MFRYVGTRNPPLDPRQSEAIADASALPVGDWLPPSIAPLLFAIVAFAAVGTLTLFIVGLIGYARRSTFRYRVLTVALGALVVRSIVGAGTTFGLVPMVVHHLVGHGADLLVAWLLLYLLYCERGTTVREADIDAATELEMKRDE